MEEIRLWMLRSDSGITWSRNPRPIKSPESRDMLSNRDFWAINQHDQQDPHSSSSSPNLTSIDLMPFSFNSASPSTVNQAPPRKAPTDPLTTSNTSTVKSPPPLPPSTTLRSLTTALIPSYRRLLIAHLPISYPPKFYALSTSSPIETGTLALCITLSPTRSSTSPLTSTNEPLVIAAIQARLEPVPSTPAHPSTATPSSTQNHQLYIQTLTTASPWRSLGLASTLLHALIIQAIRIWGGDRIESIYAHVWEVNTEALAWYQKRGFSTEGGKCEGYYRKLRPGGAWVVRRGLGVSEYLAAREEGEADGKLEEREGAEEGERVARMPD